jgi:DNA-binding PadR family transcriptional regulator
MQQIDMGAKKEITAQLTKNLLDMIILGLLNRKDMHGYEIITSIRKDYGINFGPSTIYPLLNTLEKKGYLESAWDMSTERPRKVYRLTENGRNILAYSEGALFSFCKNLSISTSNTTFLTNCQPE